MTLRRPLVRNGNRIEDLGAADSLDVNQAVELASPFTVTSTTLADVTGMSFVLEANRAYAFQFEIQITQTLLAVLVGLGMNYTAGLTRIQYAAIIAGGVSAVTYGGATANNTAVVDGSIRLSLGATLPAYVQGSLLTTAAGTLSLRAQRAVGLTSTVVTAGCGVLTRV